MVSSEGEVVRAPDSIIGRTLLGRYHVERAIARGGMAKVYRARQEPLGRDCAVKVMDVRAAAGLDGAFRKRFFLEAQVTARLNHPNIVTVYDYGETDDGALFMVMELLQGKSLHRALRAEGPFPVDRAVRVGIQVARALRESHRAGLVHRDLKPGNIFLSEDEGGDLVKVLDFGLVKDVQSGVSELSQSGLFLGSPKYSSPEQITGGAIDARTDVYAFGILLFETLTGRAPFDGESMMATMDAHLKDAVPEVSGPNGRAPEWLEAVIKKCLEKRPEDRFADFREVLFALRRENQGTFATHEDGTPTAPPIAWKTNDSLPPEAATSSLIRLSEEMNLSSPSMSSSLGASIPPTNLSTLALPRRGVGGSLVFGLGLGVAAALALVIGSVLGRRETNEAQAIRGAAQKANAESEAILPFEPSTASDIAEARSTAAAPQMAARESTTAVTTNEARVLKGPVAPQSETADGRLVHITTEPRGAIVRWDTSLGAIACKQTPCTAPASPSRRVVIALDGYSPKVLTLVSDVEVHLARKPSSPQGVTSKVDGPTDPSNKAEGLGPQQDLGF